MYQLISFFGEDAILTSKRIKKSDLPGLYRYELKGDENRRNYKSVKEDVCSNFAGTVITTKQLDCKHEVELKPDDIKLTGKSVNSIDEFFTNVDKSNHLMFTEDKDFASKIDAIKLKLNTSW